MPSQRKLTDNQVHLLKLIYKFRFVTVNLLSEYRNQGNSTIHDSLERLKERGLISRRYDSKDKIHGRPARYYLNSQGVKELKSHINVHKRIAHSYYKNKLVSEDFVTHCLNIFQVINNLKAQYPDRFSMLTEAEIIEYDQFPKTAPDLFLQEKEGAKQYFLYIYENTQRFVIEKHIKQNIEHIEDEKWPGQYPDLLIACPSPRMEQQLTKRYETHLEDFEIYFTTTKALLSNNTNEIWTDPANAEKLMIL